MTRAQVERYRKTLAEAVDAVIWMSGSPSFSPGGEAHEGWKKVGPKISEWNALLAQEPKDSSDKFKDKN